MTGLKPAAEVKHLHLDTLYSQAGKSAGFKHSHLVALPPVSGPGFFYHDVTSLSGFSGSCRLRFKSKVLTFAPNECVPCSPPPKYTCHFLILVQTDIPQILTPFGTHLDQSLWHICSTCCCHDSPAGRCPSGLPVCRCVSAARLPDAGASWQAANSRKNRQHCSCESQRGCEPEPYQTPARDSLSS